MAFLETTKDTKEHEGKSANSYFHLFRDLDGCGGLLFRREHYLKIPSEELSPVRKANNHGDTETRRKAERKDFGLPPCLRDSVVDFVLEVTII